MKASVYGSLAALVLGLASAPVFAEDQARATAAVYTPSATPRVEVVALNEDQAALLISERRKHQEALEKLHEEHKRTIDAILASTSR